MPAFELLDIDRVQPADRPGQPRLPASVRVLCQFRPLDRSLQAEAGRPRAGRDRSDLRAVAAPVHRIGRRQCLRQRRLLEAATWRNWPPATIRWFAETDLSVHEDEELLELMRESGCVEVLIGLESPVEAGLAGLELKSDWKRKHWPEYTEAVRRIQSHGIRVNGCFVLGSGRPHGRGLRRRLRFCRRVGTVRRPDHAANAFPRHSALRRLKRENRSAGRRRLGTLYAVRRQLSSRRI